VQQEVPVPSQAKPPAAQSALVPALAVPVALSDSLSSQSTDASSAGAAGGKVGEGDRSENYVAPDFNVAYFSNPEPKYPSLSRRLREQGLVKLRVHVTAEGRAGEVTLHTSSGFERLDKAALEAVRLWRFRPARRAGTPVAGWVVVPVRFELQG
jgi:protein TonB